MKKVSVKEVITDMYLDENVFKTKHIFKHGKNILEVLFVDNTEYEESLRDQKKASLYLFDEKGKRHVLITTRVVYEKTYKDLFQPKIILKNLEFHSKKKIALNIGRYSFMLFCLMLIIVNIILIFEFGFMSIVYVPILSVLLAIGFFMLNGKILEKNYEKIQEELVQELIKEYPNIERRMEQEKNYYK